MSTATITDTTAPSLDPSKSTINTPSSGAFKKPCRYGSDCRRKETTCTFTHPPSLTSSTSTVRSSSTSSSLLATSLGIRGTGRNSYHHQTNNNNLVKTITRNSTTSSGSSSSSNTTPTTPNKKSCRYGIKCRSAHCHFSHPAEWNPPSSSNSNSKKSSPMKNKNGIVGENDLHPGFYCGPLRPADAKGYRAAGIMLLRQQQRRQGQENPQYFEATAAATDDSSTTTPKSCRVQVLLCAESRKKNKSKDPPTPGGNNSTNENMEVNLLGGKIEAEDGLDARVTAAREFWEETGGMVDVAEARRLVGLNSTTTGAGAGSSDEKVEDDIKDKSTTPTTIWLGPAKYALHIMHDNDNDNDNDNQKQWNDMPLQYWETLQSGAPLPSGAEADHLVWVDWDLILKECNQQFRTRSKHKQNAATPITFQVPPSLEDQSSSSSCSVTLNFSYFTASMFSNLVLQKGVNTAIQNMNRSMEEREASPVVDDLEQASKSLASLQI